MASEGRAGGGGGCYARLREDLLQMIEALDGIGTLDSRASPPVATADAL